MMIVRTSCLLLLVVVGASLAASPEKRERKGKFFNLFNVVTFANGPCRSTDSISGSNYRNGTCLTSSECSDRGGSINGNCAAGFGSCCVFTINSSTGGTITQNCTYIQNPGYPAALKTTNAISYTIEKCSSDVCDLRLDFEKFATSGPANTNEAAGGACVDSLRITTTSGGTIPTLCGKMTGQHIYLDVGNSASATAQLKFAFTGASSTRQYEIKVTQVECNNRSRPPTGCLQYFQGTQGRIETFNFNPTAADTHLATQSYTACIRQEEGFSCVEYTPCADAGNNAFTLDVTTAAAKEEKALFDSDCSQDYLIIEGSAATCSCGASNTVIHSRYCGVHLNVAETKLDTPICDCTAPFTVGVRTDAKPDGTGANNVNPDVNSNGACLEYRQIAC